MEKKHTFEVMVEVNGKSEIEGIYQDDKTAIARAEYLLGLAKYTAVKVSRIERSGRSSIILEKSYSGSGKVTVVGDIDEACLCRTVGEVYSHDSRMTLLKVMRPYCDEQVMIPAEILHKYMPLRYIERDELLFGQITRRIANAQARQLRVSVESRLQELIKLYQQVRDFAKDSDTLIPIADELAYNGLTKFLKHVDDNYEEADRARIVTYAFSRRLIDARDWNQKIIFICELFKVDQSEAADRCLDEFLSEIVDGNVVIKAAIGYARDLSTALMSLCAALEGAVTDRFAHTPALMALSEVLGSRPMPKLRGSLLNRIALALDGKGLLTKSGREADADAFRKLIPLLQEYGGFIGGGPMAVALTRRAKITLNRGEDLPMETAIDTMVDMFSHNAGKIGYLLDLLPMEIGKRNATFIMGSVAALLSRLHSIRDLAPANDVSFSSDVVKEGFRKRLYLAGIPRKLTDALLAKLDAITRQDVLQPPLLVSAFGASRAIEPLQTADRSIGIAASQGKENGAISSILTLNYQENRYVIDFSRNTYEIGRHPNSFVVIKNDKVSRLHATIVARDGKYILSDQSRNGTMVKIGGRPSMLLERASVVLEEAGVIALGGDPEDADGDDSAIIRFRIA